LNSTTSRYLTKGFLVAAILAILAAVWLLDLTQYLSLEYMQRQLGRFDALRLDHPLLVSGGFFILYVLVAALSIPGAAVLTLLAGGLFGFWWGLGLVSIASTLGALLAFLTARFLLKNWIQDRFSDRLKTFNEGIERDGKFYLFSVRLVPVFPFFLVNLLMGLTPIKAWSYTWVSLVGMLAGTAVYVNAGTQLSQLESVSGIFTPVILGSFVLLAVFPWLIKWLFARFSKLPEASA
jgi:uncharacterized membrane protein YdjX (TVP38/TMEM64 family)